MYEHAKRYEDNTVEGFLAEDAEMQTYDEFLKEINKDIESDNDGKPIMKLQYSSDETDSNDSLKNWREKDDFLQVNQGDLLGMDELVEKPKTKTQLKKEAKFHKQKHEYKDEIFERNRPNF
jgi:hypothetical protein